MLFPVDVRYILHHLYLLLVEEKKTWNWEEFGMWFHGVMLRYGV